MSTNESLYTQLNKQGINYITHGHDGGDGFSQKYGGVEIIDNDYSYGKRGNVSGKNAVSVIGKKNGKFRHITEHLDAIEERSSIKDIVEINNKTLKQPKLEGKTQKEQIKNLVEKATVYEDRFINAVDEIGSLTK
ncbi:MAG: hypothetical protein LBD11_00210 [Candidatus Peribacteria bacterium]|jgi:hypothetical protein|nr:hypothetical protein [Candidatus Peribacteria bacterium]